MNKFILGSVVTLFSWSAIAAIEAQVDSTVITAGNPFQLTITQDGQQASGVPDLSDLKNDFVILGTERHLNYSVVNGQSSTNNQWVITLKPLKHGIVTIPAIRLGQEKTAPITIQIEQSTGKQSTLDADKQESILITTHVDTKQPYVNQQIIYTVKLYNSKRLLDADYQAPQVDNALIIPLGDAKRYQAMHHGINYIVEEQKYAIYPQKSGVLTITSPSFAALVYDFDMQRIKVQDKPIELTVQPIPKQYHAAHWLPAKQITLSDQYEKESSTLTQGSTLVRTVTMEGVGVPGQLLPQLSFIAGDGYSVYPEKGNERTQIKQGELVGRAEFKITYLFNKAGQVTIPELRLPWFNTQTGQEETAILASKSLNIIANPAVASQSASPPPTQPDIKVSPKTKLAPEVTNSASTYTQANWGWFVALFLGLGWLLTITLWWWQKQHRPGAFNASKKILKQLKVACDEGEPQKARDILLKWAALQWPDVTVLNLTDLMRVARDPHLQKQLSLLAQALYKEEDKTMWHAEALFKAVCSIKHSSSSKDNTKVSGLPPLNP